MSKSKWCHEKSLEAIVENGKRIESFYENRGWKIKIEASNYFYTLIDVFSSFSVKPEISEIVAKWCSDLIISGTYENEKTFEQLTKTFYLPEVQDVVRGYQDPEILIDILSVITDCVHYTKDFETGKVVASAVDEYIVNYKKTNAKALLGSVFSQNQISEQSDNLRNNLRNVANTISKIAAKTRDSWVVEDVAELFPTIADRSYVNSVSKTLCSLTNLSDEYLCRDFVKIIKIYKDESDLFENISENIAKIESEISELTESDESVSLDITDKFNSLYGLFEIFLDPKFAEMLTSSPLDRNNCVHNLALNVAFDTQSLKVTTKAVKFLNNYPHVEAIECFADMIRDLDLKKKPYELDYLTEKLNLPETLNFLSKYDQDETIIGYFSDPFYTLFVDVLEGPLNSPEKVSSAKAAINLLNQYSNISLDHVGLLNITAFDTASGDGEIDLALTSDNLDLIVKGFSLPEVVNIITSYNFEGADKVANTIKAEILEAGSVEGEDDQPVDFNGVEKLCKILSDSEINQKIIKLYSRGKLSLKQNELTKSLLGTARNTKDLEATCSVADLFQKYLDDDVIFDLSYLVKTLNPVESGDVIKNVTSILSEGKYNDSDLMTMGKTYKKVIKKDKSPATINKLTSFFDKYKSTAALERFSEKIRFVARRRGTSQSINEIIDLLVMPEVNETIKGRGGWIDTEDKNVARAIAEAAYGYIDKEAVKHVCELMDHYQDHARLYDIAETSIDISMKVFDPRVPKLVKNMLTRPISITYNNLGTVKDYATEIFTELDDHELASNLPLNHVRKLLRSYRIVKSTCSSNENGLGKIENNKYNAKVKKSFFEVLNVKVAYGTNLEQKQQIVREWSDNVCRLVQENAAELMNYFNEVDAA